MAVTPGDQFTVAMGEDVREKRSKGRLGAMRTMVIHGRGYRLSRPDDQNLIWYGDPR